MNHRRFLFWTNIQVWKKIMVYIVATAFLIGIFLFVNGYRFSSFEAAKLSPQISSDSKYIDELDYNTGKLYLFENSDRYHTVVAEKNLLLWKSDCSFWINKTSDKVQLIGWCSKNNSNGSVTAVFVKCLDNSVGYIEMGKDEYRVRKNVNGQTNVIFSWNKCFPWNDLHGVAYSKDGKALYELGYEIKDSTIHIDELRWLQSK